MSVPQTELVAVDLSQLELRIAAYCSRDPLMMKILRDGADMHLVTAAGIYDRDPHLCLNKPHPCPRPGCTSAMRKSGKVGNFLVQFGGGPTKFIEGVEKLVLESPEEGLVIPTMAEARHVINTHQRLYKQYWKWTTWTKMRAEELGYAETVFGRPRYLPDLRSPYEDLREAAGRQAVSEAIQGTAADLVKQAMVNIANDVEMSTKGAMLLQVHDEIVSTVFDKSWTMWYAERLQKHMCLGQPFEPYVELIADAGHGSNWKDIHK